MPTSRADSSVVHKAQPGRHIVTLLALASGSAGLSWELLWQHHNTLALGLSALGTAVTLAITMAGLAVGSYLAGRKLRNRHVQHPLRLYGLLELVVGLSGLALAVGFDALSVVDTLVYRSSPAFAPLVRAFGVTILLGVPAMAMGATVPTFVLIARRYGTRISTLYAANTAGAAIGVFAAAFLLIPNLGISLTTGTVAFINIAVCLITWIVDREPESSSSETAGEEHEATVQVDDDFGVVGLWEARVIVCMTGFATFALEVAWFRSLRAAFRSTTDSFAIILAAVLLPLALGARLAPVLPATRRVLAWLLGVSGVLVLVATPIIERFDAVAISATSYGVLILKRFGLSIVVVGLPILVMGTVLPWILERRREPSETGRIYGANTFGAVIGALMAAWLLLPSIGFAKTAWLAGALIAGGGIYVAHRSQRVIVGGIAIAALVVAVLTESGVGKLRVQGAHLTGKHEVLVSDEGPDATVSVLAYPSGVRELVIDGFQTSGEAEVGHYMAWMGRLPMLMHPSPERALVICFGTGQTANAVRREGVAALDVVELSDAVIEAAPLFASNEAVLEDPNVETIITDGRAWLRRTERRYDVITLEPMSPNFAGTNALYALEFYQLAAARLMPGGVVAQWLPFHILSAQDTAAITHTFRLVFPDSWLWIDPLDRTGILVGRAQAPTGQLAPELPGIARGDAPGRDLTKDRILGAFHLGPAGVVKLGDLAEAAITDDNQFLAYGDGRSIRWDFGSSDLVHQFNLDLVEHIRTGVPFADIAKRSSERRKAEERSNP